MLTAAFNKLRSIGRALQKPLPAWLTLALLFGGGAALAGTPTYYGYLTSIAGTSTTTPVTIKAAASQSAALMNVQNSGGTTLGGITSGGNFQSAQFLAPSGASAWLCPNNGCSLGLSVNLSGGVTSAQNVQATSGNFVAGTGNGIQLCPNASCISAPSVSTAGAVTIPQLAASQAGTLVCRNTVGLFQACSFPTGTVNFTVGTGGCADNTFCGKTLIGSTASLGSNGCSTEYIYNSTYGYGVNAFPILDLGAGKVYVGFTNHSGSSIPNGDVISASYACPYFGN